MNRSRSSAMLLASLLALAPLATSCSSDTTGDAAASSAAAPAASTAAVDPGIPLPPDWPEAVPAFEGGTLSDAAVEAGGAASALWTTTSSQSSALADYVAQLEGAGYTVDSDGTKDGFPTAELSGNGYLLVVQGVGLDGGATVSIAATPQ